MASTEAKPAPAPGVSQSAPAASPTTQAQLDTASGEGMSSPKYASN